MGADGGVNAATAVAGTHVANVRAGAALWGKGLEGIEIQLFYLEREFRESGFQTNGDGLSPQEIACAKLLIDPITLCQAHSLSPFVYHLFWL